MGLIEKNNEPFIIHPGEFVLAQTSEKVMLPADILARLEGRSSWGRLGIVIHSTAGKIDPGFYGTITLEIANISRLPVALWPGTKICQLTFEKLSSPSENPYNKRKDAKYLGQSDPAVSKIHQEISKE